MFISSLKIFNYKSFLESPEIYLMPGFNVIVGQNDAGKTALLEALSLGFESHPHLSIPTVPTPKSQYNRISRCSIVFELAQGEGVELLERTDPFYIPADETGNTDTALFKFQRALEKGGKFQCMYQQEQFISAFLDSYTNTDVRHSFKVSSSLETGKFYKETDQTASMPEADQNQYGIRLANRLRSRLYRFNAERLNIGSALISGNSALSPNASNLASVLNHLLSSEPERFREFQQTVITVFPHLKQITVPPLESAPTHAGIKIHTIAPSHRRGDLALKLSECGTGISQVLAILYVVFVAQEPQTILIDEPQSFLHPGAVRKLFEILKQHSQHQYIITSHSPIAVMATNPKTLLLVRRGETESTVESLDTSEADELRVFLREVGARLSDVFGADTILWVEGPTEEACFPLLLSEIAKQPLLGVQILGVLHTGDFEGKHSKTIFEIYERLSEGRGLLPPALGFIFDKEGRSEKEQTDLQRSSQGKVEFLPRRMYENYLLNPSAISNVLQSILQEANPDESILITPDSVEEWLSANGGETKYFDFKEIPAVLSKEWTDEVHGARILKDLFSTLSDTRVEYRKIQHGKKLTEWLISNAPSELEELANLVKGKVAAYQQAL